MLTRYERYNLKRFTVTEDHLKLARSMCVSWCDDEYGAPAVDPKRPYGNGDVEADIARLVGADWPTGEDEDSCEDNYPSDAQCEAMRVLHEDTETVLAILLSRAGQATPAGIYTRIGSHWAHESEAV